MNTIMKISSQGQIRIPKNFMKTLRIDTGDYIELAIEKGHIVLKPRKLIDPTQGWYWTQEWQKMEAEVDDQLDNNQLSQELQTAEEGIEWLKK